MLCVSSFTFPDVLLPLSFLFLVYPNPAGITGHALSGLNLARVPVSTSGLDGSPGLNGKELRVGVGPVWVVRVCVCVCASVRVCGCVCTCVVECDHCMSVGECVFIFRKRWMCRDFIRASLSLWIPVQAHPSISRVTARMAEQPGILCITLAQR